MGIEKVDPANSFSEETNGKWLPILKSLNPAGIVYESLGKILAYRIENKRLQAEVLRIKKQFEVEHSIIERTYEIKMEELKTRRLALVAYYDTLNRELEHRHVERKNLESMAAMVLEKTLSDDTNMEQKLLFREMWSEANEMLLKHTDKSNQSLLTLIQTLPPVEIPKKLLGE